MPDQNDHEESGGAIALCRDCFFTDRSVDLSVVDIREPPPTRRSTDISSPIPIETDA